MTEQSPLIQSAAQFMEQPHLGTSASAPGRVDVMGGISDYAGGLVLEGTIAERANVVVAPRTDRLFRVCSLGPEAPEQSSIEWPVDALAPRVPGGIPELVELVAAQPGLRWSAYPAGVFTSLAYHHPDAGVFESGWDVVLHSRVPSGSGVSSSAAVETAALAALIRALQKQGRSPRIGGLEAARICQWAENQVAGAPCGIMDQVTCALGQPDRLLALLCQPCELQGFHRLPEGVEISCLNSNVRHSVGGSRYAAARVAAFIGLQILRSSAELHDLNYLCQLDAGEFLARWQRELPARLSGEEFLRQYHEYPDAVTRIDPALRYSVRACTGHPVLERRRCERFRAGLHRAASTDDPAERERSLRAAGQQMYGSNWSYTSRVGLGSKETGLIVRLARDYGWAGGIYGARITGGGGGGTVALLHRVEQRQTIEAIRSRYQELTGLRGSVLHGSTAGTWVGDAPESNRMAESP